MKILLRFVPTNTLRDWYDISLNKEQWVLFDTIAQELTRRNKLDEN